jgi:hypothetical protein
MAGVRIPGGPMVRATGSAAMTAGAVSGHVPTAQGARGRDRTTGAVPDPRAIRGLTVRVAPVDRGQGPTARAGQPVAQVLVARRLREPVVAVSGEHGTPIVDQVD